VGLSQTDDASITAVDGWVWIDVRDWSPAEVDGLQESLTVVPKKDPRYDDGVDRPIYLYRDEGERIGVPWHSTWARNALKGGLFADYQVAEGRKIDVKFHGELRDDQPEAVDKFEALYHSKPFGGGILKAAGSWGKTVAAVALIARIGRTALVIVDSVNPLMKQWKDSFAKFLPDARVGIVQQKKCQFGDDYDVVIAMAQSLAKDKYPLGLMSWPGILIVDEIHCISAPTLAPIIPRFKSRFRLGASATPRRKDGTAKVFRSHVGNVAFETQSSRMVAKVRRVFTGWSPSHSAPGDLPDFVIMRMLIKDRRRNATIVDQLVKAVDSGRKIMVFSYSNKHLEILAEMLLKRRSKVVHGYYIGKRKQKELDEARKAQVIWTNYQMSSKGLSIDDCDVEVLATPMADIEQPYYRVTRWLHGKKDPVIVDFIDEEWEPFLRKWYARQRFYKKMGSLSHV
jgi:superfamily II DNA or RNA helicase